MEEKKITITKKEYSKKCAELTSRLFKGALEEGNVKMAFEFTETIPSVAAMIGCVLFGEEETKDETKDKPKEKEENRKPKVVEVHIFKL